MADSATPVNELYNMPPEGDLDIVQGKLVGVPAALAPPNMAVARPRIDMKTVPDAPLYVYANHRKQVEYGSGNRGGTLSLESAFPCLAAIIIPFKVQQLTDDNKIAIKDVAYTIPLPFRTDDRTKCKMLNDGISLLELNRAVIAGSGYGVQYQAKRVPKSQLMVEAPAQPFEVEEWNAETDHESLTRASVAGNQYVGATGKAETPAPGTQLRRAPNQRKAPVGPPPSTILSA